MGKRRTAQPLRSRPPETLHGAVVDAEVDLHGMRTEGALRRLDGFLESCGRQPDVTVVRVITGKGNRSQGAPVLLNAVGDRLRDEVGERIRELLLDQGGGAWLARLR